MKAKKVILLAGILALTGAASGCRNGGLFHRNQPTNTQQHPQPGHQAQPCPPGMMPACMPMQSANICPPAYSNLCP